MNQVYTSAGRYIVEAPHVFSIIIVALLLVNIVLLLVFGRNKSNNGEVADLLKRSSADLLTSTMRHPGKFFQKFGTKNFSIELFFV